MNEMIIDLVAKIFFMALAWVITAAGTWVAVKIGKRNELANISAATEEATKAAQRVVEELQQTTVKKMKAACEDGKLSEAEIEELGAMLLQKALDQLSDPAKRVLAAAGKDVCAIIQSAGEAMVLAIKNR